MIDRARAGDVLAGRYELRESLRTGPLGQDFSAWDRAAREGVAVTVFDRQLDPAAVARHAEVTRRARGAHPALVLPRQLVTTDSPHFAVHDALRGAELDSLRGRAGALLWPRASEIVAAAAEALAAVHRATGLAHRTLHPSSLWIAETAAVRLLDFGAAELAAPGPQARAGGVFVEYRAPEQVEGAPGDARSDVFTLAVILLEAATGVHPYAGPSAYKAAHRVIHQPAAALDVCAAGAPMPPQVRALLDRALARGADDRFADPGAFLGALTIVRQAAGSALPRAPARAPAQRSDPDVHEVTAASPRDATTMIHVPGPRSARSLAWPEQGPEQLSDSAHSPEPCLDPPAIGSGSGPEVTAAKSEQDVPGDRTPPHPDDHATAVFTPPAVVERTELFSRPPLPAGERTECLPGATRRDPVEPTQVLPERRSPARPAPPVDATVCERRYEPQTTLALPDAEEPRLRSPPARAAPTAPPPPRAPAKPDRPSTGLLLLLNLLLAVLIFCGLLLLLMH